MIDELDPYRRELVELNDRETEIRTLLNAKKAALQDACAHRVVGEYDDIFHDEYGTAYRAIEHRACLACGYDDSISQPGQQFERIKAPRVRIPLWNEQVRTALLRALPLRSQELRSLARVREPKKEDLERILSRRKEKG